MDSDAELWRGQLGQDRFVALLLERKRGGTYFDIGAGHPEAISNTWALERGFGWSGVLCDLVYYEDLRRERPSNEIVADARTLDYSSAFNRWERDGWVDFLSLDLEPPALTIEVLMQIMRASQNMRFRIACVEHDAYRDGPLGEQRKQVERAIMLAHGYSHVAEMGAELDDGREVRIEDWWVHRDSGLEEGAKIIIGGGK